jgi:predicted esterase
MDRAGKANPVNCAVWVREKLYASGVEPAYVARMTGDTRLATEYTVSTQTHGRYLVSRGAGPADRLLIGFHGYAETAEEGLERLRTIPGIDRWTLVSVQGLHQFYRRRTNDIVASWMTRQNRELSIDDNITYVANVARQVLEGSPASKIVWAGFSQGVAMAFRAAAFVDPIPAGVIACGGDIPPELHEDQLRRIPAALIGRGRQDEWYTTEKLASDERRLRSAGVHVRTELLDAGHEWTTAFSKASGDFLVNG